MYKNEIKHEVLSSQDGGHIKVIETQVALKPYKVFYVHGYQEFYVWECAKAQKFAHCYVSELISRELFNELVKGGEFDDLV